MHHVGDPYGDIHNPWKTPSYTLVDLAVHYHLDAWRAQINARHLSGEEYVSK